MQRHALGTAAVAYDQRWQVIRCITQPFQCANAAYLGQRLLQALQSHGLGEVVRCLQLKGVGCIHGMGSDEDDGRWLAHAAHGLCQHQAVGAWHLHVEKENIYWNGAALQEFQRLSGARSLFNDKG